MSPPSAISDEILRLLVDHVETYERLEILLLLRRTPDQGRTPTEVAEELNVAPAAAEVALDQLCRRSLLDVRIGSDALVFRYAPGTPALTAAVDALASALPRRRLEIIQRLSENAVARGRGTNAKRFADAFILRRKGKK